MSGFPSMDCVSPRLSLHKQGKIRHQLPWACPPYPLCFPPLYCQIFLPLPFAPHSEMPDYGVLLPFPKPPSCSGSTAVTIQTLGLRGGGPMVPSPSLQSQLLLFGDVPSPGPPSSLGDPGDGPVASPPCRPDLSIGRSPPLALRLPVRGQPSLSTGWGTFCRIHYADWKDSYTAA